MYIGYIIISNMIKITEDNVKSKIEVSTSMNQILLLL
jgi:hypothetical protein